MFTKLIINCENIPVGSKLIYGFYNVVEHAGSTN